MSIIYIIAFHHPNRGYEKTCRNLMKKLLPLKGHSVWELEGGYLKKKGEVAVQELLNLVAEKVKDSKQDVVFVMDGNFGYSDSNAIVADEIARVLQESFLGFPFLYSGESKELKKPNEESDKKPDIGSIKLFLTGIGGEEEPVSIINVLAPNKKKVQLAIKPGEPATPEQRAALSEFVITLRNEKLAEGFSLPTDHPTPPSRMGSPARAGKKRLSISSRMDLVPTPRGDAASSIPGAVTIELPNHTNTPLDPATSPGGMGSPAMAGKKRLSISSRMDLASTTREDAPSSPPGVVTIELPKNTNTASQTRSKNYQPKIFSPSRIVSIGQLDSPNEKVDPIASPTVNLPSYNEILVTKVNPFLRSKIEKKKSNPDSNAGCRCIIL